MYEIGSSRSSLPPGVEALSTGIALGWESLLVQLDCKRNGVSQGSSPQPRMTYGPRVLC